MFAFVVCRFERLFKLHSICNDEIMKAHLIQKMLDLSEEARPSFKACASTVFDTVDLTLSDSKDSDSEESALSAEAEVLPEAQIVSSTADNSDAASAAAAAMTASTTDNRIPIQTDILEAVYEQSGYVIIPKVSKYIHWLIYVSCTCIAYVCMQVLTPPSDDKWFGLVVEDIIKLEGTNNFVSIFNTGVGKSKRAMLLFSKFCCAKRFKGVKKRPESDVKVLAAASPRIHRALVLTNATTCGAARACGQAT